MSIIEALVLIYEHDTMLDYEEIEDLKLNITPIFPEEYQAICDNIINKYKKQNLT
jgi:hypothetical protein